MLEQFEGVPDCGAENHGGRGRYYNANETGDSEADGNCDELGPESVFWAAGETGEIWIVLNRKVSCFHEVMCFWIWDLRFRYIPQ